MLCLACFSQDKYEKSEEGKKWKDAIAIFKSLKKEVNLFCIIPGVKQASVALSYRVEMLLA